MFTDDAPPKTRPAAALAAAGDIAYAWDLDRDGIEWSGPEQAQDGIAFAIDIGTGRDLAARICAEDLAQRQLRLAGHFDGEREFDCTYRLRDAEGGFVWVQERGRVVRDAAGRPLRMLGVLRPVGGPRLGESGAAPGSYDALTGHFNKTRLREAADQIIATSQRLAAPGAFFAIGVDNMRSINELFGRETADSVLVEIGRRLDSCLRVADMVGRMDGDRFGVVLSHCPMPYVTPAAEKILSAVRTSPFATARGPIFATVSIGGASFPDQGATSHSVIARAELALAEAKGAGRNCYRPYRTTQEHRERARRSRAIGDQVCDALRRDRVRFAFQPVVCAETGAVDYYEALIQLRDGDDQAIGAAEFVPIVEELGFIRLVDRYVLDHMVDELAAHPNVTIGFNISGLTAADRPWLRALMSQLRARPGIAGRLLVEITETAALYDIEESARFVSALRRAGCRVALDDFGAGHTSLRHLQSLPVDTVKIAGALIANISASPSGQAFLRHLVQLARGFGFHTVAEGVETAEDAAVLRREGVGFMQGFYYGRPSFERPWIEPPAVSALSA